MIKMQDYINKGQYVEAVKVFLLLMHDVFSLLCTAVAAVLSESEPVEPVLRSIWELLWTAGQPELTRLTVNRKCAPLSQTSNTSFHSNYHHFIYFLFHTSC